MTSNPPTYTSGLGEIIRAHRLYTGLSKDGMAVQLKINGRTYDRIESGERDCPPGFLDSVERVVNRFDDEVEALVRSAEDAPVDIQVSTRPGDEWTRVVQSRAAVESPRVRVHTSTTPF